MMPHIPRTIMTKITIFPAQYCVPVVGEGGVVQFETIQRGEKNISIRNVNYSTGVNWFV